LKENQEGKACCAVLCCVVPSYSVCESHMVKIPKQAREKPPTREECGIEPGDHHQHGAIERCSYNANPIISIFMPN
jgi:hypothetical protein